MSEVSDIEAAVNELSREELAKFRRWFQGFGAEAWNRQFEDVEIALGFRLK